MQRCVPFVAGVAMATCTPLCRAPVRSTFCTVSRTRKDAMCNRRFMGLALLIVFALLSGRGVKVQASPASPHPITHRQPDGTIITIFIRGGEHFHWYEDANQYTILERNGAFVYARLDQQG